MKIKTILRPHTCQNGNYQKDKEKQKGTFVYCWWECKLMQPLYKTAQRFLKKLIELPYDPAIVLPSVYLSEENKTLS